MNDNMDKKIITYLDKVRRDHVDLYNSIVENFKSAHFILNAGVMSALAAYLTVSQNLNLSIKISIIIFFIGTLISIYAIFLDFYNSYYKLDFFDSKFNTDKDNLKLLLIQYQEYEARQNKKEKKSIILRIINGILSY